MRLRQPSGRLLLMLLVLMNSICVFAQKTVTGKVTSKENGSPIEGATVAIKGSKQSAATNEKGEFSINVASDNAVLVVSFTGMAKQELKVGNQSSISVSMEASNNNLDDVIVVGYTTQKRTQTTGAVATIKASEIQDIPAPNMAGALRGRIAGLGVSAVSGRPGASISLNVRNSRISEQGGLVGATTEPLYVVDNIIVGKSVFDALDPSMVEDITILKDASAAIYGAAGAKGVVLVTTKRGKAGPPQINYNGYVGVTDATRKPEMLSAYDHAKLLNEGYRMNNAAPSNFFSEQDLEYLKGVNNDWFDSLWQSSLTQRHNLNISGGSERMTFFVGGAYQNENANYAGMKQDKYTMRGGITAKLAKGLSADINFNVDARNRFSKNGISENDQAFLENLIQIPRWVPISVDGKWVNVNDNSTSNPFGQIASGFYRDTKTKGYGINTSLTYQAQGLLKGLTARIQASTGNSNTRSEEYRARYEIYKFKRAGNNNQLYTDQPIDVNPASVINSGTNSRLIYGNSEGSNYRVFGTLQYAKKIGDHDFNILVGGEQSRSRSTSLGVQWQDQQLEGFDLPWAYLQTPTVNDMAKGESTKRSFFGRFNYNFNNRYTLEGITRFDASSNFAANNIWGVFPTIGAGWVVSEENFFRDNVKFINYLKIRVNYGLTGDDRIDARLWQERFRVNAQSYLYNELLVAGLRPQIIPNPDITWEKKRTLNIGTEMSLFRNKLNLGVDVFQNYIYDAFDKGNDQNFPMYAGFNAPVVNYQERYAWGSEFTIGYNQVFGRDWSLRTSLNFGFSNYVTDRMFYNRFLLWENQPEDWQVTMGTDPRKYNTDNYGMIALGMFRNQDEVDAFMSKNPRYTIDGQVPQPGWLYFKDSDGDGIITDRDKTPMYDRVDPWTIAGMQIGLTWKSLMLNVNLAGSFGGKVFYDSKARRSNPTVAKNVPAFWTDRWTPENPEGRFPRYDDPSMVAGWESTFWAVDGTTIRVNDMTLAYTIPPAFVKKIGLSNVRVLVTGNNLWVLKNPLKYKDPYSSYIYDYPTLRTISGGLTIGL